MLGARARSKGPEEEPLSASLTPTSPRPAAVLARTAIDLSFFSPFATCLFYTSQGAFEGRPLRTPAVPNAPQGIYERLEERLLPTVQKQWAVWGPVNRASRSLSCVSPSSLSSSSS